MAVRRRPVLVEFADQFGEKQVVHRGANGRLAIRRKAPTVSLAMTHVVGKYIGTRVHAERVARGWTMETLAERAGLKGGKQAIYHVEQALSTGVRIGTLYAIAAALGISPTALLPPIEWVVQEANARFQARESLAV